VFRICLTDTELPPDFMPLARKRRSDERFDRKKHQSKPIRTVVGDQQSAGPSTVCVWPGEVTDCSEDWAEHQGDNPRTSSTMITRDGAWAHGLFAALRILVNVIPVILMVRQLKRAA
jgi:hypothetical protein